MSDRINVINERPRTGGLAQRAGRVWRTIRACRLAHGFFLGHMLCTLTQAATNYAFDFGIGPVAQGYTQVTASEAYSAGRGWGFDFAVLIDCFDRGEGEALRRDGCTGKSYLYFSMNLPEGNYRVITMTGDMSAATSTTIKAETRRLLLVNSALAANQFRIDTFVVNRRNIAISSGGNVGVTDRERGGLNWDGDKLTLEFSGSHTVVNAIVVEPVTDARQVFLCGNSTVCDWATETEAAWGQMIPRFLDSKSVVVNMAEAGLTTAAFISQKRLEKVLSLASPNDFVFIEFGHNDQKTLSLAQFKANLATFVTQIRAAKAIPVLVSPTPRHSFSGNQVTHNYLTTTNEDLLAGVKQLAKDEGVALIDLNACGSQVLETLGATSALKLYWNDNGTQDKTHFNDYGAYEMASCVAELVRTGLPDLAAHLRADFMGFDPKKPDPVTWTMPLSADTSVWHTAAKATGIELKDLRIGTKKSLPRGSFFLKGSSRVWLNGRSGVNASSIW
jgi:lysophospholipase L1-like esterase